MVCVTTPEPISTLHPLRQCSTEALLQGLRQDRILHQSCPDHQISGLPWSVPPSATENYTTARPPAVQSADRETINIIAALPFIARFHMRIEDFFYR